MHRPNENNYKNSTVDRGVESLSERIFFSSYRVVVGVNYPGRLTSSILAGVAGSETNYLLSVTSSWVSVERLVRALLRR
jgi:hypothetical protein